MANKKTAAKKAAPVKKATPLKKPKRTRAKKKLLEQDQSLQAWERGESVECAPDESK